MFWVLTTLTMSWYPPHPDETATQPSFSTELPDFFYRYDWVHHNYFKWEWAFPNSNREYNFVMTDSKTKETANVTLYYAPMAPTGCPLSDAKCGFAGVADAWMCWDEGVNESDKYCYPVGNHSSYRYQIPSWVINMVIDTKTNERYPAIYQLQGYKNYKMEIWMKCLQGGNTTSLGTATYENSTFNFFFESDLACGTFGKDVDRPTAANSGKRLEKIPNMTFYQETDTEYVSYSLDTFEPFHIKARPWIWAGFEDIEVYANFQHVIPCPAGFQCYGDNATIWKCWEFYNFTAKLCYPVADVSYGLSMHTMSISIYGGWDDYQTRMILECRPDVKATVLDVNTFGDNVQEQKELQFHAGSSAFCSRKIPAIDVVKVSTIGAYVVIGFWVIVSIFCSAIVINYIRSNELIFPFSSFFREFGECIYEGWRTVSFIPKKSPLEEEEAINLESNTTKYISM